VVEKRMHTRSSLGKEMISVGGGRKKGGRRLFAPVKGGSPGTRGTLRKGGISARGKTWPEKTLACAPGKKRRWRTNRACTGGGGRTKRFRKLVSAWKGVVSSKKPQNEQQRPWTSSSKSTVGGVSILEVGSKRNPSTAVGAGGALPNSTRGNGPVRGKTRSFTS